MNWQDITPVEREIIQFLADGLTNKEIANRRFVTMSTVKNQIYELTKKLGGPTRARIVALAVAGGHVKVV